MAVLASDFGGPALYRVARLLILGRKSLPFFLSTSAFVSLAHPLVDLHIVAALQVCGTSNVAQVGCFPPLRSHTLTPTKFHSAPLTAQPRHPTLSP